MWSSLSKRDVEERIIILVVVAPNKCTHDALVRLHHIYMDSFMSQFGQVRMSQISLGSFSPPFSSHHHHVDTILKIAFGTPSLSGSHLPSLLPPVPKYEQRSPDASSLEPTASRLPDAD